MTIFNAIKNDLLLELNEENLSLEFFENDISYNILTYAIQHNKENAVDSIIEYLKNHEQKNIFTIQKLENISETLYLHLDYYYKIIENFTHNDAVAGYLLQYPLQELIHNSKSKHFDIKRINKSSLNKNRTHKELINFDFILKGTQFHYNKEKIYGSVNSVTDIVVNLMDNYNNSDTISSLYKNKFYFHSFDRVKLAYKDYIANYDSYHNNFTLYKQNSNIAVFDALAKKIDAMLLTLETKEEFYEHFTKIIPQLIKNDTKDVEHADIFQARTKENNYLTSISSVMRLKEYLHLGTQIKLQKSSFKTSVEKILKTLLCNRYLEERYLTIKDKITNQKTNKKTPDTKEKLDRLSNIIKRCDLKSVTFSSDYDIDYVSDIIEQGQKEITKLYGLPPEKIGIGKLNFNFTGNSGGQFAGFNPKGNNIYYFLQKDENTNRQSHLPVRIRHFVHEYSHYLQDFSYDLSLNAGYKKEHREIFKGDAKWKEIETNIHNIQSTHDDVLYYTFELIKTITDKAQPQEVKNIIDNFIDSEKYIEHIEKYILSLRDNHTVDNTTYLFNNDYVIENSLKRRLQDIEFVQKAHQSGNFFTTLWKKLDEKHHNVYYLNQTEMHSRINEVFTGIPKSQNKLYDDVLIYPRPNMIESIKPQLIQFNKMLTNHYLDFAERLNNKDIKKKNTQKL